jgi:CMP-N-acetylneuraminic acid synthetase
LTNQSAASSLQVLALIPARSGSKGLPHKNIRLFCGKPLLVYSVEQALKTVGINRVVVSTDSAEYAEIARSAGGETPFLRPAEISNDFSCDIDVFEHALTYLAEREGYYPDIVVHLRPTHPIREVEDIDTMLDLLISNPAWDSIRSVSLSREIPYKTWTITEDGELLPVATCSVPEAYNAPRQELPKTFLQNACIDIVRADIIRVQHSMTGKRIGAFCQKRDFDIDSEADFSKAEVFYEFLQKRRQGKMPTICVDIDGVLATKTSGNNYPDAKPMASNIDLVNQLSALGYRVLLFTARGSKTGKNWLELTERQLEAWGVSYTELHFGKPFADYYIDDRNINPDQIESLLL